MVSADGTVIDNHIPRPQRDSVVFLDFEPWLDDKFVGYVRNRSRRRCCESSTKIVVVLVIVVVGRRGRVGIDFHSGDNLLFSHIVQQFVILTGKRRYDNT